MISFFTACVVLLIVRLTLFFVIGSDVHVDTRTNGNNTATIVAPEAPSVHLKVGLWGLGHQQKGRVRSEVIFEPLRPPEFYACIYFWYGTVFLILRYDMWQIACQPSVMVE